MPQALWEDENSSATIKVKKKKKKKLCPRVTTLYPGG